MCTDLLEPGAAVLLGALSGGRRRAGGGPAPIHHFEYTAAFIIVEPVDGAGGEHLLVGVTPVVLYGLQHATMLAAHNRVNIYDTRCSAP